MTITALLYTMFITNQLQHCNFQSQASLTCYSPVSSDATCASRICSNSPTRWCKLLFLSAPILYVHGMVCFGDPLVMWSGRAAWRTESCQERQTCERNTYCSSEVVVYIIFLLFLLFFTRLLVEAHAHILSNYMVITEQLTCRWSWPSLMYCPSLLANLLTPWDRVLEKLTGPQLNKKFPEFYGTQRVITAFTSACHLSLSWARSI